jgi:hypothetical protein
VQDRNWRVENKDRERWIAKRIEATGIVILRKEEKSMRKILRLKEAEEARLRREKLPTVEEKKNTKKVERVFSDEEEIQNIIETEGGRGFKKGNKPKVERRIYIRREEKETMNKQELRSNAALKFISHNANLGTWRHDPQIRKEDWMTSGTRLTRYILDNQEKTMIQIRKHKENPAIMRAMNAIRRVMMQINQCNRTTDMEEQILQYQCYLAIQALEINKPGRFEVIERNNAYHRKHTQRIRRILIAESRNLIRRE